MSVSAPSGDATKGDVTITAPIAGVLTITAAETMTHGKTIMVTKHPVEQGFAITDHARPEPPTITIDGVISKFGGNGAQTMDPDEAYAFIKGLMENPELVTVVTPLEIYDSMILSKSSTVDKVATQDALIVNLYFEFVRVVSTAKVIRNVTLGARSKQGPVATTAPTAPAVPQSNAFKRSQGQQ